MRKINIYSTNYEQDLNSSWLRHDVSAAFREGNPQLVKDHKEVLYTGIVKRDCFEVLFDQYKNQDHNQDMFHMYDIWHFLIAFHLATEIEEPKSLYIPSLIPDFKEGDLRTRLAEIKQSKLTFGFFYSFEKCDEVLGLFNKLLGRLASSKHFYKMEHAGIHLQEGFSAKIENRKLGVVAAMAGFSKWFDQDQKDEVEFLVAESDCNNLDLNKRFGRHKVQMMPNVDLLCQSPLPSGHLHLPQTRGWFQHELSLQSHKNL